LWQIPLPLPELVQSAPASIRSLRCRRGRSRPVEAGTQTLATVGGFVGAGADIMAGRSWTFGVNGGHTWMADFPKPLKGHRNFSGLTLGASVGWLWGKGTS
jgi:hypothetical protein